MGMIVNPYLFAVAEPPALQGIGAMATNGTANGDASIPYPVGLAANDIAFIHGAVINGTSSDSLATPAGWTLVDQSTIATASYFHALFWKRLTGSESGVVNVDLTPSIAVSVDNLFGKMSVWRGCIATGTPYEGLGNNVAQNANMTSSAITTLGPNRTVLHFCANDSNNSATPAALWTEEYDEVSTSGSADGAMKLYSRTFPTAGLVSAVTHPLTGSRRWQVKTLALIPA